MQKSKRQIIPIGELSVMCLIIAFILEFRLLSFIEADIIHIAPFLSGHRSFLINIFIGCACSGGVVVASEYIEFKRIERSFKYEIDSRLKNVYKVLKEMHEADTLEEMRYIRDKRLSEYQRTFQFGQLYHPFWKNKTTEEYIYKVAILDYGLYGVIYIDLDERIKSNIKNLEEYHYCLSQEPQNEQERHSYESHLKIKKKEIDEKQKYYCRSIKYEICKLQENIRKHIEIDDEEINK